MAPGEGHGGGVVQVAEHRPHSVSLLPPIGLCDGDIWVQKVKSAGRATPAAATQGPQSQFFAGWSLCPAC